MTARVVRLRVYPFKAFDGVDVPAGGITVRGGLQHDRAFAFVDERGRFLNGKVDARVHAVRVTYDAAVETALFRDSGSGERISVSLSGDLDDVALWMSARIGRALQVRRDFAGGYPDDERAPGPTIVTTATLAAVASWFTGLDVDSVRRRLRGNIEIGGVPAFWEDRLFGDADAPEPRFAAGGVTLEGTNPCARCVVPSRDPDTGGALSDFAKRVTERRAATLPSWSHRSRFDHFYRLAVNTRVVAGAPGGIIRVGDALTMLAPPDA